MVFPENVEVKIDKEGKELTLVKPRQRFFPEFSENSCFHIYIQPFKEGPAIKIKNIGKKVYDKYPDIDEIQFINSNKLKIVSNSLQTANKILADKDLSSMYKLNIPFDQCEVKGVVPLTVDYNEKEIFENLIIKHKPEYGVINHLSKIQVLEVKRLTRMITINNERSRIPCDSVCVTFSGTVLPSHVSMDGIIYPIKSFREPVLQCFKCLRYRHTTKSCKKTNALCRRCSKKHDNLNESNCALQEFCLNCKGNHSPTNKKCPVFQKLKKLNDDKANKIQPKLNNFTGFFSFEAFPPLGTRKGTKKKSSSTLNQSSTYGPLSLTDPPPVKKMSRTENTEKEEENIPQISVNYNKTFQNSEDQEFSSLNDENDQCIENSYNQTLSTESQNKIENATEQITFDSTKLEFNKFKYGGN